MARKKNKKIVRHFPAPSKLRDKSWACIGIDTSVSSLAGSCIGYDAVLDRVYGVGLYSVRWRNDEHPYPARLAAAARAHIFIQNLMSAAGASPLELDRVFIGVEEAWPAGIVKRAESAWLRQQAEVRGAFVGSLFRWGYDNVYDVNSQSWKGLIGREAGEKVVGKEFKWFVKQWVIEQYELPDMPDLIRKDGVGLISQPVTSRAKPDQPNDLYDAAGVMHWMTNEVADQLDVA